MSVDSTCTTAPTSGSYDPSYGWYVMPKDNPSNGLSTATSYWFPAAGSTSAAPGTAYAVNPTNGPVTSTYQVVGFMSDYKSSNTTRSLNTSSALVKAAGGVPGCGGLAPPNYTGVYGTYFAGALYEAQAALIAARTANPGTQNALILLSDGDSHAPQSNGNYNVFYSNATSNGYYPSWNGQCGQAVTAASAATAAGTKVFSVAYGSPQTGCQFDVNSGAHPNISPCNTMASIASAPQYFYSDYKQSGSSSTCTASQPVTSLSAIFQAIAAELSTPRLIPDSVT